MRHRRTALFAAVPLVAGLWGLWPLAESVEPSAEAHRRAATYPDFSDTVIPPNIAPLNLKVLEAGRKFCLRISAAGGAPLEVFSAGGSMRISPGPWRRLLEANRGSEIRLDIYAKGAGGWTHFDTVRNRIAAEEIDPYVVYRYLPPVYDKWGPISLRQRDLGSFDERIIIDNERSTGPDGKSIGGACVNCHTFLNKGTAQMLIHFRPGGRSGQIPAMILARNGRAEKVDVRVGGKGAAAYISWHPSGKLLTFSRNSLMQMFHTAGVEVRDVVDKDSDLGLYAVDTGQVYTVPQISRPDRLETFPAWAPDGRYLYFSSARPPSGDKKDVPVEYNKMRYDLVRVPFDLASGRWGEVETVVAGDQLGKSISLAQISPDGRYLMFCGHDYGSFPIFQPSSDLYLVDLSNIGAGARRLDEINSDRTDSYHSWSTNSRWVIFSSKREDGMFARFFIAHLGAGGHFDKPFVMPQKDPEFYGRCLMTFNRPELIREAITVSATELTRAINAPAVTAPAPGASTVPAAPAPAEEPWQRLR